MEVAKGTKCFLSKLGYYNIVYMAEEISEINNDCIVEKLTYLNSAFPNYTAVRTKTKNVGIYENESGQERDIIVWIHR
jgi:Cu2+-containing amine oxidase